MIRSLVRPVARLVVALAIGASGCVGDPPRMTPLDAPVVSDHERFTVEVETHGTPFHRGANTLVVHVHNTDGSPGQLVRVVAVMPAHGHRSDPPLVHALDDGSFTVDALDLTMPGEWEVTLDLSHDGATDDDTATYWAEVE